MCCKKPQAQTAEDGWTCSMRVHLDLLHMLPWTRAARDGWDNLQINRWGTMWYKQPQTQTAQDGWTWGYLLQATEHKPRYMVGHCKAHTIPCFSGVTEIGVVSVRHELLRPAQLHISNWYICPQPLFYCALSFLIWFVLLGLTKIFILRWGIVETLQFAI